jgi:hypothetical protein
MIWRYYTPHLWEEGRQVWEDVYLLPDDPAYTEDAIWLTIDSLGFYQDEARREAEAKLGGASYRIEGTDMIVATEDFSQSQLLEWVRIWIEHHNMPVTELMVGEYEAFRGRVPELDTALAAFHEISKTQDTLHIDPDTFREIAEDAETSHKYKLLMPRDLYEEIEALDEHEAEELMRAIASLADNPTPPGVKRLKGGANQDEAD